MSKRYNIFVDGKLSDTIRGDDSTHAGLKFFNKPGNEQINKIVAVHSGRGFAVIRPGTDGRNPSNIIPTASKMISDGLKGMTEAAQNISEQLKGLVKEGSVNN